jgi:hypothetical protein
MHSHNTTPVRFWSKVACSSPDSCWLWQGAATTTGYAQIKWNGKHALVHRLAYELAYGPIPAGLLIRHSCDTRLCCNPRHLLLGTHQDNTNDRVSRNRSAHGERHASAKLSASDVMAIRELYARGNVRQIDLARQFGVGQAQISSIIRYEKWKDHLPPR